MSAVPGWIWLPWGSWVQRLRNRRLVKSKSGLVVSMKKTMGYKIRTLISLLWFPWPNAGTLKKSWSTQRLTDQVNLDIRLRQQQHDSKDASCSAISDCYFSHFLFSSSSFVVLNSFLLSFHPFTSFIPMTFISLNPSITFQFSLALLLEDSQFNFYYFNTLHNSMNIICWLFQTVHFFKMRVVIKTSLKILKYPYCTIIAQQPE